MTACPTSTMACSVFVRFTGIHDPPHNVTWLWVFGWPGHYFHPWRRRRRVYVPAYDNARCQRRVCLALQVGQTCVKARHG
jgi:hypothetical protein